MDLFSFLTTRVEMWVSIPRSVFFPSRMVPIALLTLGIFVLTPSTLQAQDARKHDGRVSSTMWSQNIGTQLKSTLQSPSEAQRADALVLLIDLHRRYGDSIDLNDTTPVLLNIAKQGATDANRILAITALYEIGSPTSMKALAEQLEDSSPSRVRRHAARVLTTYQSSRE